jgi:hypothetical protein
MERSLLSKSWASLDEIKIENDTLVLNIAFEQYPAETFEEYQKQSFISAILTIKTKEDVSKVLSLLEPIIGETIDIEVENENTLVIFNEYEELATISCNEYEYVEKEFDSNDWKKAYFDLWQRNLKEWRESKQIIIENNQLIEKLENFLEKERLNSLRKVIYYEEQQDSIKSEVFDKKVEIIEHLQNFIKQLQSDTNNH